MKVFLSLIACLLLISMGSLHAQNRIVSGQVFSKKTNQPISGASIILRGTTIGTLSDLNGRYVLTVNQEDFTLVYSYIGYQTEEVVFGTDNLMDVYLTPLPEIKEEVKKEEINEAEEEIKDPQKDDARSKVAGGLLENIPYQSFDRALQGRTPGLLIKAASGIPGGAVNARIRGVGSIFAGNEPLYIIDGVLINNVSFSIFTQSNPLASLNPNEIESIEVLKDAASTAIYGNQGANGVVLVTTKKGKTGKMVLGLNAYVGQTMPIKYFDLLDGPEWYEMRRDAYRNSGNNIPEALTLSNMGVLPENWNQLSADELDAIGSNLPTYDWQREMMGNSMLHNYELNASGGSKSTLYYISGSYHYSGSTFSPVDFERGTIRASISHSIKNRLKLETNVNLARTGQNVPFTTDGAFLGNPAFATSLILRHNPIFNDDGSFNTEIGGLAGQNLALLNEFNSGKANTDAAIGNFVLSYKLAPNLNYRGLVGVDYRSIQEFSFRDPRTPDGQTVNGRNSAADFLVERYMTNHTFDWTREFNNSLLSIYAGYEFLTEHTEGASSIATGISSPSWNNLEPGATIIETDSLWAGYKRQGAFVGINYQIAEKYLIHVGTRYDGSSRFGTNFRYGWFPFVKLGWNLANEDFLSNSEILSDLRIRASWGLSGNDQIGDFRAIGMFGQGTTMPGEVV
jgi:TonB-dependent starch-binding outer membrane protein SusC